jgi:hypothetical protein
MNYEVFQILVLELTPFVISMPQYWSQLEVIKIIVTIFYKYVHGHSVTHMENHCNVGASTIWKYLEIVCDVSIDRDKLFSKYN